MSRIRLLAAVIIIGTGCGGASTEPADPTVPASIELSSDTLTAYPDRDTPLPTATVFNRSHQAISHPVVWTSSDTALAITFPNGGMRTKALGTVTLTAAAGPASATLRVSIVREPVASIFYSPGVPIVYGNDSLQMHAQAAGPDDVVLPDRVITWAALDPAIATISAAGLVHIHSSGVGRITATSEGFSDTIHVTADARLVARISFVPDTLNLVPGAHSAPWIYHLYDATNTELLGRTFILSSTDSSIATADFNNAYAKRVGSASIVVKADTASLRIPVTVATVAFTSVSTGGTHACGLTADHQAWCWGYDQQGQLGTQSFVYQGDAAPAPVRGGLSFTSIAAGSIWTCALTADGTPYCWGGMDELDHGSLVPKKISGVTLVSLSNSGARACGLDATGIAWCWGGGDHQGLLFIPPTGCGSDCDWTPVAAGNGTHWSALSAGTGVHVCGITTSNVAECWGSNHSGELGDGTLVDDSIPEVIQGNHAFTQVSAGAGFTCGLTSAGDAYCWGSDGFGTLGNGIASPSCSEGNACVTLPTAVAGGLKFTKIGTELDHACGLTAGGAVYCWGYDVNGDATPTVPTLRSGAVTFTTFEVGGYNCGMAPDAKVYCLRSTGDPAMVPGQQ